MRSLLLLALGACAPTALAQQFVIDQSSGGDTFGARSTGQTFTPNVGITPDPGMPTTMPLAEITLYHGNYAPATPSTTTYLNVYEGDPFAGGTYVGSSSNAVDTTALSFHAPMTFTFSSLLLNYGTEHWAVFSSTNTAGTLDLEVSLETHDRNASPSLYAGGSGLIANHAQHTNSVDARFHIVFDGGSDFVVSGNGCANTAGLVPGLVAASGPRLAQTFEFTMTNVPVGAVSYAVIGTSDQSWLGLPLPLALSTFFPGTASGCDLLVSLDLFVGMFASGPTSASLSSPIPNQSFLLGASFFVQGMQIEPVGGNIQVATAPKAEAIIGL